MPKKMNLQEIRVQSFVTALDSGEKDEVKGGIAVPYPLSKDFVCTDYTNCPTAIGDTNFVCPCGVC